MTELVAKKVGKKLTARLMEEIRLWENGDDYDGIELSAELDKVCTEIEKKWEAKTKTKIRLGSYEGLQPDERQDTECAIRMIGGSVLYWYFEKDSIYGLTPAAKALKARFQDFSTVAVG